MSSPLGFHRPLLGRLLRAAALGIPAAAVLVAGCHSSVDGGGSTGSAATGGKGGSGSGTASTGRGGGGGTSGSGFVSAGTGSFVPVRTECFNWPQGTGGGVVGQVCGAGGAGGGTSAATGGGGGGTSSGATGATTGGSGSGGAGPGTTSVTTGGDGTTSTTSGGGGAGGGTTSTSGVTTGGGGAGGAGSCPTPTDAQAAGYIPMNVGSEMVFNAPSTGSCCCYQVEMFRSGGRPFLVEERAVTAPPRRAPSGEPGDWSAALAPDPRGLDAARRRALAAAWLRDGQLEHASIASFGRFALELLAAGAPAGLVESAHRAALDEVRHAQLCFALAGAYAGERLEPAGFPFGAQMDLSADLAFLAARTAREGCIGETLAAIEAAEQLAHATDPAVREALGVIAADEARHAELAWRTVAWAIGAGGERVRAAVADVFEAGLRAPAGAAGTEGAGGAEGGAGDAGMLAHGRLGEPLRALIARRALAEVIGPCARSLLDAGSAGERSAAS